MNFKALTDYVDSLGGVGVPGCDLVVYRDHEEVYRHMAGHRDAAGAEPVRGDELYWLYSCTKVFTTCAAMQLIEKGALSLDDPVSAYLPAYGSLTVREGDALRPARRTMTVRHLMSMQSGLDYDMTTPAAMAALERTKGLANTHQLVDAKAGDPLSFEPGTDFLYSLSHDVLAAVIEVVSGMKFSDYLRKNIFGPLGLGNTGFFPSAGEAARFCAQYEFDEEKGKAIACETGANSYRFTPNYESGGAGLFSAVADCIAFADAMACGGVGITGKQILKPETIDLMRTEQLSNYAMDPQFGCAAGPGYGYGLGVRTLIDQTCSRSSIGEFGWDGAAGAYVMIDPKYDLSVFFAMHVRGWPRLIGCGHAPIRDLTYQVLGL